MSKRYSNLNNWATAKEQADLANSLDVRVRLDDHAPLGKHINVETAMNLKGKSEGRQKVISNNHVRFDSVSPRDSCVVNDFAPAEKIHCW